MMDNMNTTSLYEAAQAFADELRKWDGEEMQATVLREFTQKMLATEAKLELIFQAFLARACDDILSLDDKKFAIDLANKLGPDWAQWFYRFAVFMTKVA